MTNYANFNASRDDYADTRGVMLPALSLSQYGATLARWFGAGDADLDGVFPTLPNFTTRDLGLLLWAPAQRETIAMANCPTIRGCCALSRKVPLPPCGMKAESPVQAVNHA